MATIFRCWLEGQGIVPQQADYSNDRAKKFGNLGRPANDPVQERLRIYRAARPLILSKGVRRTTIKDVARVAYISPGGIYHYFASKRELVLYGLDPEGLSRACREEAAELYQVLADRWDVELGEVIRLYVDKSVRMLEFVRPALHAAIELGRPELQKRLAAGLKQDADFLMSALKGFPVAAACAEGSVEALRRMTLGLALDEGVRPADARGQLFWLFRRLVPALRVPGARSSTRAG